MLTRPSLPSFPARNTTAPPLVVVEETGRGTPHRSNHTPAGELTTPETHRQGRKMHPVETGVCCDHTSPNGECERWGCRYTKGEKVMEGKAGGKDVASRSVATTFPSSSLSSFSSSPLSSLPSSPSQSSPLSCHYQSYSTSDRHSRGVIGPILQVHAASSFSHSFLVSLM
jgi:hypothetical protein